jgi:hypothetical protein
MGLLCLDARQLLLCLPLTICTHISVRIVELDGHLTVLAIAKGTYANHQVWRQLYLALPGDDIGLGVSGDDLIMPSGSISTCCGVRSLTFFAAHEARKRGIRRRETHWLRQHSRYVDYCGSVIAGRCSCCAEPSWRRFRDIYLNLCMLKVLDGSQTSYGHRD